MPVISLSNREERKIHSTCALYQDFSVVAKFEVEGSGAERVETLEAVETSVERVMVALLALWIHGVFAMVELSSHFWKAHIYLRF